MTATLATLDLHGAQRVTHWRYIRHGDAIPFGWIDQGALPGHHHYWSNIAMKVDEMKDAVSPAHYKQGSVETIDIIEQIVSGYDDPRVSYHIGNVLKYVARAPHKGNAAQDLEKALWYLRRAANTIAGGGA